MNQDFSWTDLDCVVLPRVEATAVYTNPQGNIVIRQELEGEDDQIVVIPRQHVQSLIDAICREVRAQQAISLEG